MSMGAGGLFANEADLLGVRMLAQPELNLLTVIM